MTPRPTHRPAKTPHCPRGRRLSKARRKQASAPRVVQATYTSGIRTRVKRKSPQHVARPTPASIPACGPKAHRATHQASQHSAIAASAAGTRAAQSCTPNAENDRAMAQTCPGGLSKYTTPFRRAVTQSPDSSMDRATCAYAASTSSSSAGGLLTVPRKAIPETASTSQPCARPSVQWAADGPSLEAIARIRARNGRDRLARCPSGSARDGGCDDMLVLLRLQRARGVHG